MTETTTTRGTTSADASGTRFVRADRLRLTQDPTLNELWLRERIVDDPSVLGLGDLRLADEGHTRDGRLELLLRDPASGRRLTVLVRVGPAQDSDLVRAIENWTIERGRYPEHEHFAVIVAEEFPPRVLTAASSLGAAIPLTAMQVGALRVGQHVALHFSVVVDRLPHVDRNGVNRANGAHAAAKREATVAVTPEAEAVPEPAAPTALDVPSTGGNGTAHAHPADAPVVVVAPPSQLATDVKLPEWLSDDGVDPELRRDARRGRGRFFSLVCLISLLLCASAVFGWVRSYGARDRYSFADGRGGDHFIYSERGQVEWIAKGPSSDAGGGRSVRFPWWLPAGLTAILPIAWLVRGRDSARDDYDNE